MQSAAEVHRNSGKMNDPIMKIFVDELKMNIHINFNKPGIIMICPDDV